MITSTSAGASASCLAHVDTQSSHWTATPLGSGALIDRLNPPWHRTPPEDMPEPPFCPGADYHPYLPGMDQLPPSLSDGTQVGSEG